ncbi:MAG: DUF6531 domain-containing protein [Parachlamydiaceae bacterium]
MIRGTHAALCYQSSGTNASVTSFFAERFSQKKDEEKLHAFFAFIGAAYFEKCTKAEKELAALHKVLPTTTFAVGLAKLSPDHYSSNDLRFPQVDMHRWFNSSILDTLPSNLRSGSCYAAQQYRILANADASSNEHQVLREIYQDKHAISTVKLLQIAHQEHQRKGLSGPGFLTLTRNSLTETEADSTLASQLYFSHLGQIDLQKIRQITKNQWDVVRDIFAKDDGDYMCAYMTPGTVSSQDGYWLMSPSYTGFGTLFHSQDMQGALISNGAKMMQGGYGSRLQNDFLKLIHKEELQLVSNGGTYSCLPSNTIPLFNGVSNQLLPDITFTDPSKNFWTNSSQWNTPLATSIKADVRHEHKSSFDMVADPVDIVSGAFYVDETDLTLRGSFPLEIRRNYNSQNPVPNCLGHGWKMSLNPYLIEKENKLYAAEQDGTIIVYRQDQDRWIIFPEDNPELRNHNSRGIGGTANPFHAYIERKDGYVLYGSDGSRRHFHDNRLTTWTDSTGNTLTFTYEQEQLVRIENMTGGFLCFEYNHGGKLSEAYANDGRRICYTYDFAGNLATVKLPNEAVITYEYDSSHRIIRESKPHGRVLENVYKDDKVVEQRSPVGQQQCLITSATFTYAEGVTTVTDAAGGCTEYKIFDRQIYKITDPEGHQTLQSWFLDSNNYFDAEIEIICSWDKSGAYPRSLKSSKDKRGLTTSYLYDCQGNIKEITLVGNDLTGKGDISVSKHFTYNANNLCIQEETLNTRTLTTYDSTYTYLPKRIEQYADNTLISFIELEYTHHGLVIRRNDSGAISLFEYDNRDFPIKKTQMTGTDDPAVLIRFRYNNQGQCIELITADAVKHQKYDIMGNCYHSIVSLPSGQIVSQTYADYDLNNELVWKQGDDPNDTLFLDYNAAGLLKASRKNLSQFNGSSMEPAGIAYTLYEYDACGRLFEQVDPLGNCTFCDYDALGRIKHSTKHGLTATFTYEAGGLIASVTTPSGATTSSSYTTNGLLKSEIYPDGTENSYIYDLMGRPIQETKSGITSTICYDDAAREEMRSQGELTEVRRFDARGNLISLTDRAGFTWTKTYDSLNRVKTKTTPNGEITQWNYLGDTIVCTLPSGEKNIQRYEAGALAESKTFDSTETLMTQIGYKSYPAQSLTEEIHGDVVMTTWTNTLGLPVRIQQGSKVTTHYYDASGNCVVSVDGEGNTTYQEFDPVGRLAQKKLPDGALITYEYDADSNLSAYHMPGNLTWKATYDSVGHKRAEWQEADGEAFQRWEYIYTNGLLSQVKDPLHRLHQYAYDIFSRLAAERIDNYSRIYTYDPRGLLTSVIESGKEISKVERAYDESGRLIQENISLNGTVIQNTEQEWTPSSRSLQIGNHRREFLFQGGHVKALSSGAINLSYDYALSGSLIRKTTPFSTLGIQYNDALLPQAIDVQLQGSTYKESIKWTPGGKLASYDSTYPERQATIYNYTSRGYLKSTQDNTYIFDFDKPGRGIRTASPNLEVSNNGLDKLGRIVEELVDTIARNTAYDDMGQVIIHGKEQLQWDPWGRLIAITSDTYKWTVSYDALGRRLQTKYTPLLKEKIWSSEGKTIVTISLYDPEHEFQEIGVINGEKTYWKMYEGTSCDAIVDSNGEVAILHHDIRNNLIAVVTPQTTHWNRDYPTPYGPPDPSKAYDSDLISYALSFTWQSKSVDPTGLIWLGARYYDPKGGRFLSPDPVSHPACLDLYAYANGDPINNTDPDGRFYSPMYDTLVSTCFGISSCFGSQKSSLPKVYCFDMMEMINSPFNRSGRYDLSDLGRPELPEGLRVGLMNGILNTPGSARTSAEKLSDITGGFNVHGTYGATQGGCDLLSCILALNYVDTGRVRHLHNEWNDFLDKNPDTYYLHFCHSRGAIDTRNALLMYSEEKRKRIIVVAIAPAAYIYEETCAKVTHYRAVSWRDPIPYIDVFGAERAKHSIVTLTSHPDAPWHDHGFTSETYQDMIQARHREYVKSKGRLK